MNARNVWLTVALGSVSIVACSVGGETRPTPEPARPVAGAPAQQVEPVAPEPTPQEPVAQQPAPPPEQSSLVDRAVVVHGPDLDADHAFPPTVPDTDAHRDAWDRNDCLRCHETGVGSAPQVRHIGMVHLLLEAKCRTCHVLVPGSQPREQAATDDGFEGNAFPPMIPASGNHTSTWNRDDCLLCHESGVRGAPIVQHRGMPRRLLESKCRTCHVQVRAIEASDGALR